MSQSTTTATPTAADQPGIGGLGAPAPDAFLDVRDLRVHFPTDDGVVKSVDGLSFDAGTRQDARHRRRVGLRQERDQPVDHGPAQARHARRSSGAIWLDGTELVRHSEDTVRKLRGKTMAMIFQDPLSAMHPFYTVGPPDRRGVPAAQRRQQEGGARSARSTCSTGSGSRSPRARRRLPAPVLRRHAAAGDDRDGARRATPTCSSPTSRPPRSTSPCRRRSST